MKFESFSHIVGRHITIVTDCQVLMYINSAKITHPQIMRWFDLQESDIEVEHRSKENIAHADALSRIPVEEVVKTLEKLVEDRLEILTGIENWIL